MDGTNTPHWLPTVAAAHAAGADDWLADEDGASVQVRRVTGGFNNALYCVQTNGQRYAVKLCIDDERRRAAREHAASRLLRAAGLDLAPRTLWLDESCTLFPFPAVVYGWLSGGPLEWPPTSRQWTALLDAYGRIHALRQHAYAHLDLPGAWFHWFDFKRYLVELHDLLAEYGTWLATSVPDGRDLRDRLARLLHGCTETLTTTDVNPARDALPLGLCRVDPNLANVVWNEDGRLRWVDWEYSGWGDPALDLAELRWHVPLADVPDPRAWQRTQTHLRQNYPRPADDPAFDERIAVWDRFLSVRWPLLVLRWLWSLHNGPDRPRLTQFYVDPATVHARLVWSIERAEWFEKGRDA
jgi:Ser/Thr protein kinase RdoA (MazF antagonist)